MICNSDGNMYLFANETDKPLLEAKAEMVASTMRAIMSTKYWILVGQGIELSTLII